MSNLKYEIFLSLWYWNVFPYKVSERKLGENMQSKISLIKIERVDRILKKLINFNEFKEIIKQFKCMN